MRQLFKYFNTDTKNLQINNIFGNFMLHKINAYLFTVYNMQTPHNFLYLILIFDKRQWSE